MSGHAKPSGFRRVAIAAGALATVAFTVAATPRPAAAQPYYPYAYNPYCAYYPYYPYCSPYYGYPYSGFPLGITVGWGGWWGPGWGGWWGGPGWWGRGWGGWGRG